jgi:hypothetical protein
MKTNLASIGRPLATILCGISLIAALPVVFAQTTNFDDDQAKISQLLKEIERSESIPPKRDKNGEIVSLSLEQSLANDERIEIASKIHSLRELQLGYPKDITKEGISHLVGMTNLSSMSLWCVRELKPGVFEEICKIQGLRKLSLSAVHPPAGEYAAITNLQLLTVLHIGLGDGTNFGDHQLSLLTNLHNLKSLDLGYSGITFEGMKILHQMTGLTNVNVLPKR